MIRTSDSPPERNEPQEYVVPTSLDEALRVLADRPATILAGGTDLTVQTQAGRVRYQPTLMNIRRVPELTGIAEVDGALRIGALTTITELGDDPLVQKHFPLLGLAVAVFASPQIRNAGTVGGNLCNASPAGDTLPPLLVLGAEVELARAAGEVGVTTRRLSIEEFLVGPGKTAREPDELLTAVHVPLPVEGLRASFYKFGTRPALDISTVSVAISGRWVDGALHDVRAAFGAVAPTVYRARATEAALEGVALDAAAIDAAAQTAHDEINPIDDVRATAWYRREMIASLTKKVLRHVAES